MTMETTYYLLSMAMAPNRLGEVVRSHWAVENRLH
jgi:predicted transposase YbfD/YdcC